MERRAEHVDVGTRRLDALLNVLLSALISAATCCHVLCADRRALCAGTDRARARPLHIPTHGPAFSGKRTLPLGARARVGILYLTRHCSGCKDCIAREGAWRADSAERRRLLVRAIQMPHFERDERGHIEEQPDQREADDDPRVDLSALSCRAISVNVINGLQHKEEGEAAEQE
eukprot:scaffold49318_cov33-Tisochrysis_lutea.AAC.4